MSMDEVISERLVALRKHLGERLGERLTVAWVAEQIGVSHQAVYRLEDGLKGTTMSLVTVLMFYSSHGYNLEWILATDNSRLSMMVATANQLQKIGERIREINQYLSVNYQQLTQQMAEIGYLPLDSAAVESDEIPTTSGLV